jgi:hypothetical protein
MEVGLGFGLLSGVRGALGPGVRSPCALSCLTGDEDRLWFGLGISNEIRPSARDLTSSGFSKRSAGQGDGCLNEGVDGAGGGLLPFNMFSKWLRREETGFCAFCELNSSDNGENAHDGGAICVLQRRFHADIGL